MRSMIGAMKFESITEIKKLLLKYAISMLKIDLLFELLSHVSMN